MIDFQLIVLFVSVFRKMLVSKGMKEGAKNPQRTHEEGNSSAARRRCETKPPAAHPDAGREASV